MCARVRVGMCKEKRGRKGRGKRVNVKMDEKDTTRFHARAEIARQQPVVHVSRIGERRGVRFRKVIKRILVLLLL